MTDLDRGRRLRVLFEAGRKLPRDEQVSFCRRLAGDDAELRTDLDELLKAACHADPVFLDEPLLTSAIAAPESAVDPDVRTEDIPQSTGPYRLLEVLGEGGMGTVYRAEQTEPVQREVAVKVIAPGMSSRRVLARFATERRALARMGHPGIAEIYEAGTAADGRPWFAMELVRGELITTWCDRERLSVRERVELFRRLCNAVQHAHQKGVIHRDLKPANVLVTVIDREPSPKIIDFGIARAIERTAGEAAGLTQAQDVVGTPNYMSPEQLRSDADVDTRSDVFSLGVMLYELLCGERPFSRATDGLSRAEDERARPPSTRVRPSATSEQLASLRGADARALRRSLRGDLDWITLRALESAPECRYSTASELGADLQRFLRSDPVEAGPPRVSYRIAKALQRHRLALGSSMMVLLSLVAGVIVATAYAIEAEEQAEVAGVERGNAVARLYALHDEMWHSQAVASFAGMAEPIGRRQSDLRLEILRSASPSYSEEHERIMRGWTGSLRSYRNCLRELRALAFQVHHGGNPVVQSAIANQLLDLGRRAADIGSPTDAELCLRQALSLAEARDPSDPILVQLRFEWLRSLLGTGREHAALAEETASRWLAEARSALLAEHDVFREIYRAQRGGARLRLGKLDAARDDITMALTTLGSVAAGTAYHREALAHAVLLFDGLQMPQLAQRHRHELADRVVQLWSVSEAHGRAVLLPAYEALWSGLLDLREQAEDPERDLPAAAAAFTGAVDASGIRGTRAGGVLGVQLDLATNSAGNRHGWQSAGVLALARLAEELVRPQSPSAVSLSYDRALMNLGQASLAHEDFSETERIARLLIGRRHAYGAASDFHHWVAQRYLAQCEDRDERFEQAGPRLLRAIERLIQNRGPADGNVFTACRVLFEMWQRRDALGAGCRTLQSSGILRYSAPRNWFAGWLRRADREELAEALENRENAAERPR